MPSYARDIATLDECIGAVLCCGTSSTLPSKPATGKSRGGGDIFNLLWCRGIMLDVRLLRLWRCLFGDWLLWVVPWLLRRAFVIGFFNDTRITLLILLLPPARRGKQLEPAPAILIFDGLHFRCIRDDFLFFVRWRRTPR